MDDVLERAHALRARGEPFAVATVIRVVRPASARPGMKAIILADGAMEGWVGGACAHPVVAREAQAAIRHGAPRLIRLSPERDAQRDPEGVVHHPMTCHSGGTLEIYVEPVLPRPQLLLVGEAPLVSTLARLGRIEGFAVWIAEGGGAAGGAAAGGAAAQAEADLRLPLEELARRVTPQTYAVVATMGSYDEDALALVAGADAAYIGLVASRRRAEAVLTALAGRGTDPAHLQRIRAPAGLDIGAATPEEIALSIMAEIVQVRRRRPARAAETAPVADDAIDPVCGMTVSIAGARHTLAYQGRTFYFCCAPCRETFAREPARYAAVTT
jgi:xanthine dehydrogenase accessory factor